jgi:hypothetical protein
MTTELVITVPHTGELLEVSRETAEHLADVVTHIRDLESRLREVKQIISEEIAARCDREGKWSFEAGEYKLSIKSNALVPQWDVQKLLLLLDQLVALQVITPGARERAVQPRTEYKVLARGVDALLKNPDLAGEIEACRELVEPTDRRLVISRG